jgi:homoserine kinase type II
MAVFTNVQNQEIQNFLINFEVGSFIKLIGITSGIENSNFFLHTSSGDYILTIFERLNIKQLDYYLKLMLFFNQSSIKTPKPIANKNGELCTLLCGKPASIVSKLNGASILIPNIKQLNSIGSEVAKMHNVCDKFYLQQNNLRSIDWWNNAAGDIISFLNKEQQYLLATELDYQKNFFTSNQYKFLTSGAVHCDIFRDNVMFIGNEISGIFDFYFAGNDKLLFDLCVIVNDWCVNENLHIDQTKLNALLLGYTQIRTLSDTDIQCFPFMLRAAALRFWVSRLWDLYLPRDANILKAHDPKHFELILIDRRNQAHNIKYNLT